MKKTFYLLVCCISFSSCCTLFTPSSQPITFVGDAGTKIYDDRNGQRIATVGESGETTVKIRKKLSTKYLVAKQDGHRNTRLMLESTFNPIACINLFNILAWGIDLATQKVCKWDNTYFEIEMEKAKDNN